MSDLAITPEGLWPPTLLYWTRLSSKEIADYVANTPEEKRFALIVWGTVESHGPFMPVANDSHLAALAADEVARRLHEDHGVQPIIFDGFIHVGSPSATWEFPGAIGFHDFIQSMWEQTLSRMMREGFKKFFLVNGDGGNWLNHWAQLKWNSPVLRDLTKQGMIFWGSNWDQEGGEPYVHAGEWDHALIKWACDFAPEFTRLSALRHGLRAPDESKLEAIEGANMAWLEDEPWRTTDWSQYPDQKEKYWAVTQFSTEKYRSILYNKDGTPRTEGGAQADFEAKIGNLMGLVLKVVEGKIDGK